MSFDREKIARYGLTAARSPSSIGRAEGGPVEPDA